MRVRLAALVTAVAICASGAGGCSDWVPNGDCDDNYSGACVPPYPPDVNCGDIGTSVRVVGSDPHGLDGDGDGVGCEGY